MSGIENLSYRGLKVLIWHSGASDEWNAGKPCAKMRLFLSITSASDMFLWAQLKHINKLYYKLRRSSNMYAMSAFANIQDYNFACGSIWV
jgi:hypothetical protein